MPFVEPRKLTNEIKTKPSLNLSKIRNYSFLPRLVSAIRPGFTGLWHSELATLTKEGLKKRAREPR